MALPAVAEVEGAVMPTFAPSVVHLLMECRPVWLKDPTQPENWPLLAVLINGLIHFDFWLNFGALAAPGIFGQVTDTIIYLKHSIEAILKWVDDFIFF